MTKRILIVAAILAATVVASAQQLPPGKWWQREAVIQNLQLTGEQQDRLDEIFRDAANDLIDAKAEVDKLQVALRGEIDRSQLRRQEIQRIAARLSEARGRLFEREMLMLVDMRSVLTDEQWRKMRMFLERAQDRPNPQQRQRQLPPKRR
jgi:Skp family chaperone for outer membrane proteins